MTSTNRVPRVSLAAILFLSFHAVTHAGDVFVDGGASGNETGATWADAFVHLQDGLAAAGTGDSIHVAGGVYYPDRNSLQVGGSGDRFEAFRLRYSLTLRGGYAGAANAGDPNQHNPTAFPTVLSGDLAQNDGGLFDPNTIIGSHPASQDNSAHVLIVANAADSTVNFMPVSLQDLVIEGGFARQATAPPGQPDPMTGGGLLCFAANTTTGLAVTLDNCTVQGNFARTQGGGIASAGNGLLMRDCRVVGNASRYGAGYAGVGQASDDSHAHLTALRTIWAQNHVRLVSSGTPAGGALALDRAIVDVRSCIFYRNSASTGNAAGRGGAVYVHGGSVFRAYNNTFRENRNFSETEGATLYCEDLIGGLEFVNNICWGAVPLDGHMRYPLQLHPTDRFGSNDIEDKANNLPSNPDPGQDIDVDPLFANALGKLSGSSPCVDGGLNRGVPTDTEVDYDGITRILDHASSAAGGYGGPTGWGSTSTQGLRPIVDIGAFEFMLDCNGNGIPDGEDISSGASNDCDGDEVPDECQPDCNSDGVPDACDVDCQPNGISDICEILGGGPDCNGNGIPDECEPDCDGDGTPDDCEPDCDDNGTPDDCEPADCDGDGTPDVCEPDCNKDGIPDDCEPDCDGDGTPDVCEPDCNKDGVPDDCEPDCDGDGTPDVCEPDCDNDGLPDDCEEDCDGDGTPDDCEPDCDGDGLPDDCEPDCDGDGIPDDCEAFDEDCNSDGVPDACQMVDCNGNGILDICDIASGFSDDCDENRIPDECEWIDCNGNLILDVCDLESGFSGDCDRNGVPDECEGYADCNGNRVPDFCDILDGTSEDLDGDGVPDECQNDCSPGPGVSRYEFLTPGDTYSVVSATHAPEYEEGFAFVSAANKQGDAVAHNHLIGTLVIMDGMESFDYQVNAVSFRSPLADGLRTDLDFDCHLDLNGLEYEMAPDELLVPRFIGQNMGAGLTSATLVLVGLSGGTEFDTNVDFLLYNDNEEVFSTQHTFRSWAKVRLLDISGAFSHEFLRFFTDQDPEEVLGDPDAEAGWFSMQGRVANSSAASIYDPAIYGFLIERGGGTGAASPPFEQGSRTGHLLPGDVLGDNEEARGVNPNDPTSNVHRRSTGSLLLYPEFDNHAGVLCILTVTNVGKEAVTARFTYYGQ